MAGRAATGKRGGAGRMKRAWGFVALAAMASALTACSLLKKGSADGGEDGASEASAAAATEAGPVEAVNESEMTRYPDEKPVDHAPLDRRGGRQLAHAGRSGRRSRHRPEEGNRGRKGRRARAGTISSSPTTRRTRRASSWAGSRRARSAAARLAPERTGAEGRRRRRAPRGRCGHEAHASARPRQAARRSQDERRLPRRVRRLRGGVPHDLQERRGVRRHRHGPLRRAASAWDRARPLQVSATRARSCSTSRGACAPCARRCA